MSILNCPNFPQCGHVTAGQCDANMVGERGVVSRHTYKIERAIKSASSAGKPDLEYLDFVVINIRTGNPVAAFLTPGHAQRFIDMLRFGKNSNTPMYEVVNADGTSLVKPIEG